MLAKQKLVSEDRIGYHVCDLLDFEFKPNRCCVMLCCGCVAVVLRLCCGCVAVLLRLCCGCVAVVLRLCCGCVAVVLRLCCVVLCCEVLWLC
jgi:hypothetical protein